MSFTEEIISPSHKHKFKFKRSPQDLSESLGTSFLVFHV